MYYANRKSALRSRHGSHCALMRSCSHVLSRCSNWSPTLTRPPLRSASGISPASVRPAPLLPSILPLSLFRTADRSFSLVSCLPPAPLALSRPPPSLHCLLFLFVFDDPPRRVQMLVCLPPASRMPPLVRRASRTLFSPAAHVSAPPLLVPLFTFSPRAAPTPVLPPGLVLSTARMPCRSFVLRTSSKLGFAELCVASHVLCGASSPLREHQRDFSRFRLVGFAYRTLINSVFISRRPLRIPTCSSFSSPLCLRYLVCATCAALCLPAAGRRPLALHRAGGNHREETV